MSLSLELGTSSGGVNTGSNLSDSSFLFLVPQIPQIPTNLNLLGSGILQVMQMTQFFLQIIYHPSQFSDKNRVND